MRSILSLIIALSLTALVRAQDESESPASSPTENSTSSMQAPSSLREAPSATPQVQTSAPAATPKPSAAPSASPAAEKKRSTTASEETTSASTSSEDAGPDKGKPESVVKKLETEWEAAVMKHDGSFVEKRVAKDFMGVSSRGKRLNKSALLKEFKSDTDTYTSAKNGSLSVRAFDKNIVVASGQAKEVGKTKDGSAFNRSYLFTDTWVMRGDRWECVASQVMLEPSKK